MPDGARTASGPGTADRAPSRFESPSMEAPPARSLRPVEPDFEVGAAQMLHPSIPVRFSDVIEELRSIADLASGQGDAPFGRVAAACRRAESLLLVLRRQFLNEVVLGDGPPGGASPA